MSGASTLPWRITGQFEFAVEENSGEENHIIAMSSCFEKLRFQNVIRPTVNGKPVFSNSCDGIV